MKTTDKSVTDHSQSAELIKGQIVLSSKVGRKTARKWVIPLIEWEYTYKGPSFNENYNQQQLIYKLTEEMDYEPGGPCQADRIRDSMIRAIKACVGIKMD